MPARMPIGVLTRVDKPTIIRLPTIALRRPPPSLPGAGVSPENIVVDSAPKPLASRVQRIQARTARPIAIASTDSAMPTRCASRRLR